MQRQAKPPRNPIDQLLHFQPNVSRARFFDEARHLIGDLVRSVRAALDRQQPSQAVALEVGPRLVEGRPTDSEVCGGIRDGLPFHAYASQHFVTDLNQIPGIEEVAVAEGGIIDVLRARIHSATLFESGEFGIGFSGASHM
ncbi:hypothetical protein PQR41_44660 [Paraburkholderia xenovorans]